MSTERMIFWSIVMSCISLGMSIARIIQMICEK
jgi:hypothetical protein